MQLEFMPNLVQNLAIAITGFLLLSIVPTVLNLVTSYLVGAFIALVPTVVYFHFKISPVRFGFDKTVWKEFFHIAYPLALVGVVSAALYNNIDSLMLGFYGQLKQNGWYSAAYRVVTFSLLPMVFIYQSFFPAMSKALEDSHDRLEQLWGNQFQVFSFLGFPIFFGGILLSGPIIRFLYPAEYEPAVVTLKILIGCVLVIYLQMPFKQVLVVFNQQKKVFYMFLAGMVLNIVLNIITIPYLSLNGTAISTLIAQTLVLAGLSFLTVRKTHLKILTRSTKIVCSAAFVSSVAMVCVLSLLDHNLHIFWLVGIGILVYLVLFFSLYRAGKSIIDIYEPQR
jgi:O-antigen/teichoic acid export membrane protein